MRVGCVYARAHLEIDYAPAFRNRLPIIDTLTIESLKYFFKNFVKNLFEQVGCVYACARHAEASRL